VGRWGGLSLEVGLWVILPLLAMVLVNDSVYCVTTVKGVFIENTLVTKQHAGTIMNQWL
jgi:uncharacterized protein (DUF983 family)